MPRAKLLNFNTKKNESKSTAQELRKKIGLNSSFSGKTLVDLAKEGK